MVESPTQYARNTPGIEYALHTQHAEGFIVLTNYAGCLALNWMDMVEGLLAGIYRNNALAMVGK